MPWFGVGIRCPSLIFMSPDSLIIEFDRHCVPFCDGAHFSPNPGQIFRSRY